MLVPERDSEILELAKNWLFGTGCSELGVQTWVLNRAHF
jgi:hypothetical protein